MNILWNIYLGNRRIKLFVFLVVGFLLNADLLFAENLKIMLYPDKLKGKINPLIFGSSMIGYNPVHTESWGHDYVGLSNYGAGIWNPDSMASEMEVVKLAKEAGITIFRFPGGSGSLFYNWKETIGPPKNRPKFLYGLDEFLKTCEDIGSEAIFTLPYITGGPDDAADLVEYLNAPNDNSNPGGGIDWAKLRANNGHPEPYRVKYFELGNEVSAGAPTKQIPGADPVSYANDYLEYRRKMKTIDSSIKLGAVTVNYNWSKGISPWDDMLFRVAGDSIDFIIEHTYSGSYNSNNQQVDPNEVFQPVLKSLESIELNYRNRLEHFEKVTGRKGIPMAVTEFNVGFNQERPVPFRHSLGAALFNAGLIQIFMKPENNILMANYWQFVNSYWGMIKNDNFMKGRGQYIKRPNYYTYEMFNKHFGDELVDVNILFDTIVAMKEEKDILSDINWQTKIFSGAEIKTDKGNVEVLFKGDTDLNFHHVHKKVPVKPNTVYHLSGLMKAEDLRDSEGVGLQIIDGRGWDKTNYVVYTERVWGTTDWVMVDLDYTTLSDASEVLVTVRRISGQGIVKGKVYVKDVKLVEKEKGWLKGSNALSVTASRNKEGKYYIMVLNKDVYKDIGAYIDMNEYSLIDKINVWTLNASSIHSTNEKYPRSVVINHNKIKLNSKTSFNYIFPAHSLTSLEFEINK
ncbi:hypothetical protein C4544_02075 [candidate division WS5 bacterium]|uniref:non-reducing end alpha-L-arabinofuranosidase n=1 Tax=candidate division WS5 bacterium TaxID=2093353 RepID=A0A419DEZ3_9BACT|nr:MAG: hypothetical protein C4544_02075 [candidate division WS5 bacterium]